MIWRDAADLPSEWTRTGSVMENFAHLGATPHQLVARRLNVGDNQEQAVQICDRDGDHLELQVDLPYPGAGSRVFTADCGRAHSASWGR